jgi:hypothetical protein
MTMSNWSVTHALYAALSPFRLFPSLWINAEISCKSPTRWDFWHVTLPTNGGELSSKYGPLLSAELCLFLATIRSLNRFYFKMKSYRLNVAIFVVGHSATGLRLYWVSAEHDTQPNFVKNEKKIDDLIFPRRRAEYPFPPVWSISRNWHFLQFPHSNSKWMGNEDSRGPWRRPPHLTKDGARYFKVHSSDL